MKSYILMFIQKKEKDFLPQIKSYRSIYRGYRKIGGLSTVPLDIIHVNLIKNINIKVFDWTVKLRFPEQRLPLKAKAAVVISDIYSNFVSRGNGACQSSLIVFNLLMPETECDHLSALAILPNRQVVLEGFQGQNDSQH